MKKLALFAFTFFSLVSFAQKNAVVYNINFTISPELRYGKEVSTDDRNVLNGVKSREIFPSNLIDTLLLYTEVYLSEELGVDVKTVYRYNKKGKRIETIGTANTLEELPFAHFKKTVSEQDAEYYIDISAALTDGGVTYYPEDEKRSVLEPQILFKIKVYDAEKNLFWNGKTKIVDLGILKSKTKYKRNIFGTNLEVTKRETLSPEDILWIYLAALERTIAEH